MKVRKELTDQKEATPSTNNENPSAQKHLSTDQNLIDTHKPDLQIAKPATEKTEFINERVNESMKNQPEFEYDEDETGDSDLPFL